MTFHNSLIYDQVFMSGCYAAEENLKQCPQKIKPEVIVDGLQDIGRAMIKQINKETFNDTKACNLLIEEVGVIFNNASSVSKFTDIAIVGPEQKKQLEGVIRRAGISYGILSGVAYELENRMFKE